MAMPNIGPQIGLHGVKNYVLDLDSAKAATKAFLAELKSAQKIKNPFESAVKQTGALESEIDAQVAKVNLLSDAYQKAVEKYGQHSKQAYKAQEELAKAEAALSSMLDQYSKISTTKIEIQGIGTFKNDIQTLTQATKTFKAEFDAFGTKNKLGEAFEKAAGQSNALKKAIETQKASVKLLEQDYDRAAAEQGEFSEGALKAKENVARANTELANMEKTLKELPNGLQNVSASLDKMAQPWGQISQGAGQISRMMMPMTTAYTAGVGAAAKTAMDFEYQMSKVQAVTASTDDQIAQLSDTLLNMSKGTIYAPQQLAEGFEKVARAGITETVDQLAILQAGLDLATAEGVEFDSTADGIISTLYQFNMEMTEAGNVADIVAQASRSAKTDAGLLFETFKQAAPSMNAMNFNLRDTALAADLMADSALVGSQAGTYLKTSMANLTAPTDKQREAMEKFNITLEKSGKSVSFVDLLGQLRTSFGGLDVELQNVDGELKDADQLFEELSGKLPTEQLEKLEGVVTIFGKRSLPGMLAMINATDERFEELKGNLAETTGVAGEMAKIVGDSTTGGWQKLQAGLQVLGIEMGQQLLPFINSFLEKATEWVTKFSEMDDGTKRLILTIGGVVAAAAPIFGLISGVTNGVNNILTAGSNLSNGIGLLSKVIGGAGGGAGLIGSIGGLISAFGPLLLGGAIVAGVVAAAVLIYKNWDKIKEAAAALKEKIGEAWGYIKDQTAKVWEETKNKVKEKWDSITSNIQEKASAIKNYVGGRLSEMKQAFDSNGGGIKGTVAAMWSYIKGNYRDGFNLLNQLTGGKLAEVAGKFLKVKDDAVNWGRDMIQGFIDGITEKWEALKSKVAGVAQTVKDFLGFSVPKKGPLSDADTYMPDFIQLLSNGLRGGAGEISAAADRLANAMVITPSTHYADLPAAGSVTNTTMGNLSFNIYAQPGQDVEEIAEAVEERISSLMNRREVAYA